MCNRYRLKGPASVVGAMLGIDELGEINLPPGELFPKRPALVARQTGGRRVPEVMTWGFPPPPAARGPVTNVRNLVSPFWRSALVNPERRCLIPASEFCEWEGETGKKVARWFSVPSQPVFVFAGVWRPVEEGAAFAMLTCEPNAVVAPVHPKAMPVILHPEDHDRWLQAPMAEVLPLAAPFPSQLMAIDQAPETLFS
jgi:putative SOS response-associated peptidase YedK